MKRTSFYLCLIVTLLVCQRQGRTDELTNQIQVLNSEQSTWLQRQQAAEKIGAFGDRAIPPLLDSLGSNIRNVQLGARLALIRIGPKKVIPALQTALRTGMSRQKLAILKSFGDFGKDAAPSISDLGAYLENSNVPMALAARRSLILIGRDMGITDDQITYKSGRKVSGILVKSTGANLSMLSVQRFKDRTSVMTVTISTNKVAEKALVAEQYRPILNARQAAYREILSGKSSRPATFVRKESTKDGGTIRSIETDQFLIKSSAPWRFVTESAIKLDAMSTGYEDYFRKPVTPGPQILVILAGSVPEYMAIQKNLTGSAVLNSAMYFPSANVILGYSDLDQWNKAVAEANTRNTEDLAEIQKIKRRVDDAVVWVEGRIHDANQHIDSEVRAHANNPEAQRWAKEERAKLNVQVAAIQKEIAADRALLNKYEAIINGTNEKNVKMLNAITKEMYEGLAHEAFHAFFRNRIVDADHATVDARWLNEGLAQYFESSVFDGVDLKPGSPNKEWISFLQKCQKDNSLVAIGRLLKGAQEDFIVETAAQSQRSHTFYRQSWYLVRYLTENGTLSSPEPMAKYVADIAAGKDAATAFKTLAGRGTDEVWKSYDDTLKLDDAGWYTMMTCPSQTDSNRTENVLARIVLKSGDTTKIRLRDGSTRVVETDSLFIAAE